MSYKTIKLKSKQAFFKHINDTYIRHNCIFNSPVDVLLHIFTVIGNGYQLSNDGFLSYIQYNDEYDKPLKNNIRKLVNDVLDENPTIDITSFVNSFTKDELADIVKSGYILNFKADKWKIFGLEFNQFYREKPFVKLHEFTTDISEEYLYQMMCNSDKDFYPGELNYSIFKYDEFNKNSPSWFIDIALNTLNAAIRCMNDLQYDDKGDNTKEKYQLMVDYLTKLRESK